MKVFLPHLAFVLSAVASSVAGISTIDHDKVVGCYFGAWAFYRPGVGKFDIPDFDASLCTHGYYGFSNLDNHTWEMVPYDPWYDLAPEDCEPGYCNFDSYRRFTALAKDHSKFKPILSLGGWNAGSERFSVMAADSQKKQTFLDSVIPFLQKYGFQGLDLDWEYPGNREGSDPDHDKENFSALVKELGELLHSHNMIFSSAMSPDPKKADVAYHMNEIIPHLDIFNVMTYDYHGWFPEHNFTGENAPLYRREEENVDGHPGFQFNVFDSVHYYLDHGVPKEKIVVGMAAYGRGFKLVNNQLNGLYCPADDGIPKAPYTRQIGIWGYNEIISAFQGKLDIDLPGEEGKWTSVVDDCYKTPYAFNGPYWIGYDDIESIALKAQYVNFLGVGGAMIWSKDTDDFSGLYSNENYPLLRKINEEFSNKKTMDPENPKCKGSAPMCPNMGPTTPTPSTTPKSTTPVTPPDLPCNGDGEVNAYPGNCHWYYRCADSDGDGEYDVQVFDCGDDVFDPNTTSCIDPGLPGNDLIC